jgi:hypothetical protein
VKCFCKALESRVAGHHFLNGILASKGVNKKSNLKFANFLLAARRGGGLEVWERL